MAKLAPPPVSPSTDGSWKRSNLLHNQQVLARSGEKKKQICLSAGLLTFATIVLGIPRTAAKKCIYFVGSLKVVVTVSEILHFFCAVWLAGKISEFEEVRRHGSKDENSRRQIQKQIFFRRRFTRNPEINSWL